MTRLIPPGAIVLAVILFGGTLFAGDRGKEGPKKSQQAKEVTIFVTGSLIPQRVRLNPIATTTVSPVRVIDRREIDTTGRFTTGGAFVNEPSVRVIGH